MLRRRILPILMSLALLLGVPATTLLVTAGPASASTTQGQAIVNTAASQAGVAYCGDGGDTSGPTHGTGGSGCGTGVVGFDCSGLALYAVYQATGITLPHGHGMESAPGGTSISEANLQPGDLVFFGGGSLSNFEHVGIYAGNGMMWDANDYNVPVQEHSLAWEENALAFDGGVRYSSSSGSGPGGDTTGTGIGPAVAMNSNTGMATAVAQGPNHSLYAYWQLGVNGQWAGPIGLGGGSANLAYSQPAIAFNPNTGLATVVAEGPKNSLYAYWQTSVNGQWYGPVGIDGGKPNIAYSAPSIAMNPSSQTATVVAQGPNHSLYAYWQLGVNGSWAGPLGIDGGKASIAYSAPSIAMNETTGMVTAVAQGPSNSLYAYWQLDVNGQWAGPLGIDGGKASIAYSDPSITMNQTTQMATVVAEGPKNSLYAYWQLDVNGSWAGPIGIDGGAANLAYSNPSIAMNQSSQMATAVAEGPSNSLYGYWQLDVNGSWAGPIGIDGGKPNIAY